jgi:hypothetical protein
MKKSCSTFPARRFTRVQNKRVRHIKLHELMERSLPLPMSRNTSRAIVMKLVTSFPMFTWAFVKMM